MRSLWCGIALALALALSGCGKSEWQEFAIAEGGFSVLMRGQAQYARQLLETPIGPMQAHLYSSDRPDGFFAVGYTDYPLSFAMTRSPQEILLGVRDTWVRRVNGQLATSDNNVRLGKYPGLEFSARGAVSGKESLLEARLYMVDQRLYQVISIARTGEMPQGTVNRFFKSFRLTDAAQVGSIKIDPGPSGK